MLKKYTAEKAVLVLSPGKGCHEQRAHEHSTNENSAGTPETSKPTRNEKSLKCLLCFRQGLVIECRLAPNSQSSCLGLLKAGIAGVCYHTQLLKNCFK